MYKTETKKKKKTETDLQKLKTNLRLLKWKCGREGYIRRLELTSSITCKINDQQEPTV